MSIETIFLATYISDATQPFAQADLVRLLETSRRNNALIGVTGLLLHAEGNFLQALEGPEWAVRETLGVIERDRRHHHVQVLVVDHIPERLFSKWSMAFAECRGLDVDTHPGLSAFLAQGTLASDSDHSVIELLHSFRDVAVHR